MKFTVFDGASVTPEVIVRWANGFTGLEEFWNTCHDPRSGRFCKKGTPGARISTPGPDAKLVQTIRKAGGATLDFKNNMAPIKSGFAVAVRPEAAAVFPMNSVGKRLIKEWLTKNKELLSRPDFHVGAWHDKKTNKVWLDVTRVYPNTPKGRSLAMRAAGRHKQIAIYHLDADKEIEKRNADQLRSETASAAEVRNTVRIKSGVAEVFACRSAACRPPTSGGTGGSSRGSAAGGNLDAPLRDGVESAARKAASSDFQRYNVTDDRGTAYITTSGGRLPGIVKVATRVGDSTVDEDVVVEATFDKGAWTIRHSVSSRSNDHQDGWNPSPTANRAKRILVDNLYRSLKSQVGSKGKVLLPEDHPGGDLQFGYGPRSSKEQMKRRLSPRSVGGMRDPSLKWPWLYDLLRAKGYDKEKAARISNSRVMYRKKGRLNVLNYKQADNLGNVRRAMHKK